MTRENSSVALGFGHPAGMAVAEIGLRRLASQRLAIGHFEHPAEVIPDSAACSSTQLVGRTLSPQKVDDARLSGIGWLAIRTGFKSYERDLLGRS